MQLLGKPLNDLRLLLSILTFSVPQKAPSSPHSIPRPALRLSTKQLVLLLARWSCAASPTTTTAGPPPPKCSPLRNAVDRPGESLIFNSGRSVGHLQRASYRLELALAPKLHRLSAQVARRALCRTVPVHLSRN